MRITVFGIGYVGIVQAAVLAESGYDVMCVDIDQEKIEKLRQGEVSLFEPGLPELVAHNLTTGRLRFTTDPKLGVSDSEILMIAVGTPTSEDGSADLSHVLAVADTIGTHLNQHALVVVKSTVPVGTCDKVRQHIQARLEARGHDATTFDVASNPEFLKEGAAVECCLRPDRIIIGVTSQRAEETLRELYAPFNRNHEKIIVMDIRSAELTKYAANCMLATRISFMNEIANLAGMLGADVERVRHGIGSDPRIGYHFIYPGVGYGGSCFPKDVRALIHSAEELGFDAAMLKSVQLRNERQKHFLVDRIMRYFGGNIAGRTFALWGLAFKPETDDMREAPSRVIMEALWAAGANVRTYDPEAMGECRRIYGERGDLIFCEDRDEALKGADALVLVTEWKNFRVLDFDMIRRTLNEPVIFDGRNIYDPAVAARAGVRICAVGRQTVEPIDISE